jgi:hypothetical protein
MPEIDDCILHTYCEERIVKGPKLWRQKARTMDLSAIAQQVREECASCTSADKQRYRRQRQEKSQPKA